MIILICLISFSFLSYSHFAFFYHKDGRTPLFIVAQSGHKEIVQVLLEKGNPNVDLATKVLFINIFLVC